MKEIGDRINELIDDLGVSKNEFAKQIGISSSLISQITTKKNNFRADILQRITGKYEDLNTNWLLNGIGDMWQGSYKINNLGLRVENENSKEASLETYRSENKELSNRTNKNFITKNSNVSDINKKTKFWNDLRKLDIELDKTFNELGELIDNISNIQSLIDEIYLTPNRIDYEIESLDYKTVNSETYKQKALDSLKAFKSYYNLILNLNHGINNELLFNDK